MAVVVILIAIIVGAIYAVNLPRSETQQVIPANIGYTGDCHRPIHTHDATGTLHVEPIVSANYTVGDFFLIWGKKLNSSGIFPSGQSLAGTKLDCLPSNATPLYHDHHTLKIVFRRDAPANSISMTVNGNPQPLLQNYVLPRNPTTANIVITYGPGVPAPF